MSDEYSAQVDAPGIFQPKDVDDDDDDDDANGHDIVDDNNDAVFD